MRKYILISGLICAIGMVIIQKGHSYSDILGWGKITWGMTHSQISKIYELEDWSDEPPSRNLKTKIDIQGDKFSVTFLFDKKSSSAEIKMIKLLSVQNEIPLQAFDSCFQEVYDNLVAKYGKVDSIKREDKWLQFGLMDKEIIWIRKSGKLELFISMMRLEKSNSVICAIMYSPFWDKGKL
jgi:hypothetical protein